MNNTKKIILIIGSITVLIVALALIISSCLNNKEIEKDQVDETMASDEIEADEEQDTVVEIAPTKGTLNFDNLFPESNEYLWIYETSTDVTLKQVITNMAKLPKENALAYEIEGNRIANGYITPYKRYFELSKDGLIETFNEVDLVLLSSPLALGTTWDTPWFDTYGYFNVTGEITGLSDEAVTITFTTKDNKGINAYDGYTKTITISKDLGITEELTRFHDTILTSTVLESTAILSDHNFVSFYNSSKHNLSDMIIHDYNYYLALEANAKGWTARNITVSDDLFLAKFNEILQEVQPQDLQIVSTLAQIAKTFGEQMDNPDLIIWEYFKFYEEQLYYNVYYDVYSIIDYDELYEIGSFDAQYNFVLYSPESIQDPYTQGKASILLQNGVSLDFTEGYGYFTTTSGYIISEFSHLLSEDITGLYELYDTLYAYSPIVSDGGLTKPLKDLADLLFDIEGFINSNTAPYSHEYLIVQMDSIFAMLTIHDYDNTPRVINGILSTDFANVYSYIKDNYTNSDYAIHFENLYAIYEQYGFMVNSVANEYFSALGFEVYNWDAQDTTRQLDQYVELSSKNIAFEYGDYSDSANYIQIEVDTVIGLLENLKPNTHIKLAPGIYQLPYTYSNKYISVLDGTLTMTNLDNLIIEGDANFPVTIVSESFDAVIEVNNGHNIIFDNLRVGHLYEFCHYEVYRIVDSENIIFNRNLIFGCGEWGMTIDNTTKVRVLNTLITECKAFAFEIMDSYDVIFEHSMMSYSGYLVGFIESSQEVYLNNCFINNNYDETSYVYDYNFEDYEFGDALFQVFNSEQIVFNNPTIMDNRFDGIYYTNDDSLIYLN